MNQIPEYLSQPDPGAPCRHALHLSTDDVPHPDRFQGDTRTAIEAMNSEIAAAVEAVDQLHAHLLDEAMKHAPKMAELGQLIDKLTTQAEQLRKQISQAKQPVPESVSDMRRRLEIQARIIGGATDDELLADATDADDLRVLADTTRACRRQALQEAAQARLIDMLTDGAPERLRSTEDEIRTLTGIRDRVAGAYRRAVETIGPRGRRVVR